MKPISVPSRITSPGAPPAFTLLELMLVLALMAFLLAIAWPTLRRPLQRSATQQAASQLAEEIAAARLHAIETGQTMALRYEWGGSRYWIGPAEAIQQDGDLAASSWDADAGLAEDDVEDVEDVVASDSASRPGAVAQLLVQGMLENEVIFQDPETVDQSAFPTGSTLDSMLADELAETEEVEPLVQDEESVSWSAPVLLYPTGRAENASIVLAGEHGYYLTVTVRGLTGAVTMGELRHDVREAYASQATGEQAGDAAPEDDALPATDLESWGAPGSPGGSP